MLIQNVSITAQTPQFVSDGASGVAVPSNAETQPSTAVKSPQLSSSLPPSPRQLQSAVDGINQAMRQLNHNLQFSVDDGTRKPVVKMVDTETGALIRQIPSDEILAIARSIDQFLQRQGLLFNQKA